MTPSAAACPPQWDRQSLERSRTEAIEVFIEERAAEGGERYRTVLAERIEVVTRLFAATDDLRDLGSGNALSDQAGLIEAARYLGGPPVSADDLDTLAETSIATRRRLPPDLARKAASVISTGLDQDRFPWLFAVPQRAPTAPERYTAIRWTAGLMAVQRVQTERRNTSAVRQQAKVRGVLRDAGFVEVRNREINVVGDLARGEYCVGEVIVAGTKCDVPVGLHNGRLLLIECKVSNSGTNSVKRLNREVGGKAGHWREAFGQQACTAAVLSGVFKLKNLEDAQDGGVAILWEHDLSSLASFLRLAV
ncbi:MAG: XamI family restriction endonuclease [Chloroflexi bacterium]|nr:XamI family restriction endonuclease [Chloroflexota bacterium]